MSPNNRALSMTGIIVPSAVARGTSARNIGDVFSEGGGQINLMLLFLTQDFADVFGDRIFPERLTLPYTFPVVPHRHVLVLEVGAQHRLGIVGLFDGQDLHRRRAAEVVDVAGNGERMRQFLLGMRLELL